MQIRTHPRVAVVIGAGDAGSAIAVALHRAGFAVVLCDEADPAWPRRGMAFTNAWYLGNAELEDVGAVFCSSVRSIPTVLARRDLVAATTWSWAGVSSALEPVVIVDARLRRRDAEDFRASGGSLAQTSIGVGPGFVGGGNVDFAVESRPGPSAGEVIDSGPAQPFDGDVPQIGGAGRERFVYAPAAGRFVTSRRIGAVAFKGDFVGAIGAMPVVAPLSGVLRGLCARGSRVQAGARVVEIDSRGDSALCFGIEARPRAIAVGVLDALAQRGVVARDAVRALGTRPGVTV